MEDVLGKMPACRQGKSGPQARQNNSPIRLIIKPNYLILDCAVYLPKKSIGNWLCLTYNSFVQAKASYSYNKRGGAI